jgi:hypothetical protein
MSEACKETRRSRAGFHIRGRDLCQERELRPPYDARLLGWDRVRGRVETLEAEMIIMLLRPRWIPQRTKLSSYRRCFGVVCVQVDSLVSW